MRFLGVLVCNALALWLTTLILSGGLTVTPYEDTDLAYVLTLVLLGAIWGVTNGAIGNVVRIVSLPLYCLTLGLFALVVNGFLFWLVSWVSGLLGFGLSIKSFWWAIGGALLMSFFSAIFNGLFNRAEDNERRERD